MPQFLENQLRRAAQKKGLTGNRANAYVYGSPQMQAYMGSKPQNMDSTMGTMMKKKKMHRVIA